MQEPTTQTQQDKPYLVIHRLLDFILFLIQGILLLDFILLLAGANRGVSFFQIIDGLANILMTPFRFILPVVVLVRLLLIGQSLSQ